MEILILKSMSNKKFISAKHENYHTLSWQAKRIWLSEEIPVISDGSVVYNIICKTGLSVEGRIVETGFDEIGFYIVFNMYLYNFASTIFITHKKRIAIGRAELGEVFNPHEDEKFKLLSEQGYMEQHLFHRSFMHFSRNESGIIFKFTLGNLRDVEFEVELSEIIKEEHICKNNYGMDALKDGKITDVYFRKNYDGEYVVKIDNSYVDYAYPKGHDCFSEEVKPKAVEHKNQYVIKCKNIKVQKNNYFISNLELNHIKYCELHNSSEENFAERIREKWISSFLEDVDTEDIFINHYLWHVFSYERLIAVKGTAAQDYLNKESSNVLYVFLNDANVHGTDICYRLKNAAAFNHEMLLCYSDVYVTNEDFTWTYVKTHEDGHCGPYFYKKGLYTEM